MFPIARLVPAVLIAGAILCGCGQQAVQEKTYQVKMPTGLEQAKQLLQRYADGASLGSEFTSFPQIIEEVKKTDPQKAQILEQGVAELEHAGPGLADKAKTLLEKLK
jgi:hypothetical protein